MTWHCFICNEKGEGNEREWNRHYATCAGRSHR